MKAPGPSNGHRSIAQYVVGFLALSCLSGMPAGAMAGPPFLTDDPEPVEYHHTEFYIASQQTLAADGRAGTLPAFEFNYGAHPDVQLHIVVPFAFSDPRDGQRQSGLGDIELGVKYRFLQETDGRPQVGFFPLVELPTGNDDRGLGSGRIQVFLPLWAQKDLGGKWSTYFGGGYWWVNNTPEARDHWFFGWQLQRELSEHLTLGGEVFHSTEPAPDEGSSSGFNIGGFYNVGEHGHLLFSVGRGLQNARSTNEFSSYLAYQWTY